MYRIKKILLASIAALITNVAYAVPVTINFDDLNNGDIVDTTYAGLGVTFVNAKVANFGTLPGGSGPFSIVHKDLFSFFGPDQAIMATFSTAVSSITLTGLDVGTAGFLMTAYDSLIGGNVVATDSFTGTGKGEGIFYTMTLNGASIRRVEFSQIYNGFNDQDGITFDNLVFETARIPEPASVSLLMLGLLGLTATARRSKV